MPQTEPEMAHIQSKARNILLVIGIMFIAINLRPALASVGPLVGIIREHTGLSNSLLGLLTTLPLIAFGLVSTLTPLFTRRFGIGGTLAGALLLITIGVALRALDFIPTLFIGTAMFGTGIAFGNVLLPSLVKRNFPTNSGIMTSLYSAVMAIGASLAAGLSIQLANTLSLGWRGSLGIWAILSLIAFFVWLPQLWHIKKVSRQRSYLKAMKSLTRSMVAWKVALFMGLQSMAFYVILAWLPEILQSRGIDSLEAGWMLSLSQATGVFGSLFIPIWAGRIRDQRPIVYTLISLELISLIALMNPQIGFVAVWVSLIGFALGGSFGLALLLIVHRSEDSDTATELSGMAQSIGYLLAALGPILLGGLFDITGNWNYSLFTLLLIALVKLYMGLGAAKPVKLELKIE